MQYSEPGIYVSKSDDWDREGWTSVPNRLLRDKALPWEAKGVFGWLASHRRTFAVKAEDLAEAGPKGRDHARRMLRCLEQHGWLTRKKLRSAQTGRFDVHLYELHASPVPLAERTWSPDQQKPSSSPAPGNPGPGNPGTGGPGPGLPGPYIEKTRREEPPSPAARGDDLPAQKDQKLCEHGSASCRACGTNPRALGTNPRVLVEASEEATEGEGRACRMCVADGALRDGNGTRWLRVVPGTQLPVTPYDICDHVTPHAERLRQIQAADEARSAARVADTPEPQAPSAAREEIRQILASRKPKQNAVKGSWRQRRQKMTKFVKATSSEEGDFNPS